MRKRKKNPVKTFEQRLLETVQDLLITELGKAGVPQLEIRKILGVDIVRVNRILKHFKQ